jgi:hypothetical protein
MPMDKDKDEINKKRIEFTILRIGKISFTRAFIGIICTAVFSYYFTSSLDIIFQAQSENFFQRHSAFMLTYFFPPLLILLAIYSFWEDNFSKNKIDWG